MVQSLLFHSSTNPLSFSNLKDYDSNGSNMDSKNSIHMMSFKTIFKRQWIDSRPYGEVISDDEGAVSPAGVGLIYILSFAEGC